MGGTGKDENGRGTTRGTSSARSLLVVLGRHRERPPVYLCVCVRVSVCCRGQHRPVRRACESRAGQMKVQPPPPPRVLGIRHAPRVGRLCASPAETRPLARVAGVAHARRRPFECRKLGLQLLHSQDSSRKYQQ
ncbi:Hypothetical predicted protein [Olea europaea subsp. europaea]|uniref:Uncharacterized protein n=1 Tax=Olea europaea subsp. europaea TaxID=158383 RepID=A0A8S0VPG3_OLEEU|nr:Hypothetical predicted protein [Olea europaea subsp. europaea]